jgi:hypothetical protein
MARLKIVNGVVSSLTPEEEAVLEAEEQAWRDRRLPTNDELDQDELNRMLAQDGSVVRALAEVLFQVAKVQTPTLTKQQFITLLKSKMRS